MRYEPFTRLYTAFDSLQQTIVREAGVNIVGNNNMVENLDVEHCGGGLYLLCNIAVLGAYGGVARRMVVDEYQCRCQLFKRELHQYFHIDKGSANPAPANTCLVDNTVGMVKEQYPELLVWQVGQYGLHYCKDIRTALYFGTLEVRIPATAANR